MTKVEEVAAAVLALKMYRWQDIPEDISGLGGWDDFDLTRENYREIARAAIEAMRVPTPEMVEVGAALIRVGVGPVEVWSAMIAVALADPASAQIATVQREDRGEG